MAAGKIALITGASRGIGHAVAVRLAKEGYGIAAVGTREEGEIVDSLEQIRCCGNPLLYIKGSITLETDRKEMVNRTLEQFGRIDVLVNNAGVAPRERLDILETTEESFDYVVGTNLRGTFFLTQQVAGAMIRQAGQGEERVPRIINISSMSAYTSSVNRGEYCISKAGISMVTALFADRLAEYGIPVFEIRPGIISTDMTSSVRDKYDQLIAGGLTPIKRWGKPKDVADAVSVLCSGMLDFSTGQVINVDGGFHLRRL